MPLPPGPRAPLEQALDHAHQANVIRIELELHRELHQAHGAGVARVQTVTETWRTLVLSEATVDQSLGRVLQRAATRDVVKAAVEHAHAGFDIPAVVGAEREHAGSDAGPERRPRRRDVARHDG